MSKFGVFAFALCFFAGLGLLFGSPWIGEHKGLSFALLVVSVIFVVITACFGKPAPAKKAVEKRCEKCGGASCKCKSDGCDHCG